MDIGEAGQIRAWIREMRIPILKTNFASGCFVLAIDLFGGDGVQVAYESRKRLGLLFRYRHEMVVIWEDCPCLQLPPMLGRQIQEFLAEQSQAPSGLKQRFLPVD